MDNIRGCTDGSRLHTWRRSSEVTGHLRGGGHFGRAIGHLLGANRELTVTRTACRTQGMEQSTFCEDHAATASRCQSPKILSHQLTETETLDQTCLM